MPFQDLVDQLANGTLKVQVGKVLHLDQIVEARQLMEKQASGRIVVLT